MLVADLPGRRKTKGIDDGKSHARLVAAGRILSGERLVAGAQTAELRLNRYQMAGGRLAPCHPPARLCPSRLAPTGCQVRCRRKHPARVPHGHLKRLETCHQTANQLPLANQRVFGCAENLLFEGGVNRLSGEKGGKNLPSLSVLSVARTTSENRKGHFWKWP